MSLNSISVVLPAYKEAENLEQLLPSIEDTIKSVEHEIIVVDAENELDNTKEICQKNHVKYVNRTGGNTYGDAIRTGISASKLEYILIMDADGSHNPEYIPSMLNTIVNTNSDLVIGSRYCKGGDTNNPLILKVMSKMLNLTYKIVFGLKVNDVSDSFRIYRAEQLKKIELSSDNFDIVEEILILLHVYNKDLKITEVPIVFRERMKGESKRDLFKFILSYLVTMKKLLVIKRNAKKKRERIE